MRMLNKLIVLVALSFITLGSARDFGLVHVRSGQHAVQSLSQADDPLPPLFHLLPFFVILPIFLHQWIHRAAAFRPPGAPTVFGSSFGVLAGYPRQQRHGYSRQARDDEGSAPAKYWAQNAPKILPRAGADPGDRGEEARCACALLGTVQVRQQRHAQGLRVLQHR